MEGRAVTDEGVADLANVKGLTGMSIRESSVTDVGLTKLKRVPALNTLTSSGPGFTLRGLRELRNIPKLRLLSLASPIDTKALMFLREMQQLDSLGLSGFVLNTELINTINQLNNLSLIHISYHDVGDEQLTILRQLEFPISLSLSGAVTDPGWRQLPDISLRYLSIKGAVVSDSTLRNVGLCRGLQSLLFAAMPIPRSPRCDGATELKCFSNATWLSLNTVAPPKPSPVCLRERRAPWAFNIAIARSSRDR